MKFFFTLLASVYCWLLISAISLQAQELNAEVTINTPTLQTTDPQLFETLENDIREFLNSRRWTNDNFRNEERIACSFVINITQEISATRFKAQATIQSSRPVYNSGYKSVLFTFQDTEWVFDYAQFQPLEFNENAYTSEITALLAYYANVIIGFDYDSFEENGGSAYFNKAKQIVNTAQNGNGAGWRAFEDNRNRYWLTESYMTGASAPIRQSVYNYHRKGLDVMYENPAVARQVIINELNALKEVKQKRPNSFALDLLVGAKSSELIRIFKDDSVNPGLKAQVVNAMAVIDPANFSQYNTISSSKSGARGNSGVNTSPINRNSGAINSGNRNMRPTKD